MENDELKLPGFFKPHLVLFCFCQLEAASGQDLTTRDSAIRGLDNLGGGVHLCKQPAHSRQLLRRHEICLVEDNDIGELDLVAEQV